MNFQRHSSFIRSLKGIKDTKRLRAINEALEIFIQALETQESPAHSFSLKRLRGEIWEIRSNLHDRILFSWKQDNIYFLLAGNHDDIQRFLKNF